MPVPAVSPRLGLHIRRFFELLALPPAQGGIGKSIDDLANLSVMAGVYYHYPAASPAITRFGRSLRPRFAVRVAQPALVRDGMSFRAEGITIAETPAFWQDLGVLLELGDPATDSVETLRAAFGDTPDAERWAQAIAGTADRATRFAVPLGQITAAPAGAPSTDIDLFHAVLMRGGCYDAEGAYVAKYQGGTTFPDNASARYKELFLREVELNTGDIYVYGIFPENTVDPSRPVGRLREFLGRFVTLADDTVTLQEVYTAARGAATTPMHQFCFFHAHEGIGLAMTGSAGATVAPGLAHLIAGIPDSNAGVVLAPYLAAALPTAAGTQPVLRLVGTVPQAAALTGLPAGVILVTDTPSAADEEDSLPAMRSVTMDVPLDQVGPLAARDDVTTLELSPIFRSRLTNVSTKVNRAALLTRLAVTGGGEGVVVGILDSGIDPAHPAFGNRIKKVWDQRAAGTPPTLTGMGFGAVYTGAAVSSARDYNTGVGHGTHVASIAAGERSAAWPYDGMAPKADIYVVALRDNNVNGADVALGLRWLFHEATQAGKPCVANLSYGYHDFNSIPHGHDGMDDASLGIRAELFTPTFRFKPGRALCVASGNEGDENIHAQVASLAPGATHTFRVRIAAWADASGTNRFPTGPLGFGFYARPIPANVRGCTVSAQMALTAPGPIAAAPPITLMQTAWIDRGASATPVTVLNAASGPILALANTPEQPYTRHARVLGVFRPAGGQIPRGTWEVRIKNTGPVAIEVHGYLQETLSRTGGSRPTIAAFFVGATRNTLLLSPAAANAVISVGSENNTVGATSTLSSFSCPGPARGARRTLSTVAPGGSVTAALASTVASAPSPVGTNAHTLSGTSMATPVITGLIACLLEKEPNLDYGDIRTRLRDSHRPLPAGGTVDDWGPGPVDAGHLRT